MNESLKEEIKLLDINEIATYFFIISLIVSNILTHDEKMDRLDKKRIFSSKTAQKIAVGNRTVVLILGLVFLYINYANVNIAIKKNRPTKYLKLQVNASIISIISSLIVLYVAISNLGNNDFNVSGTENPEL